MSQQTGFVASDVDVGRRVQGGDFAEDRAEEGLGQVGFERADLRAVLPVLFQRGVAGVAEDVFGVSEAVLHGNDVESQFRAAVDERPDLAAGEGESVAQDGVLLEGERGLPLHDDGVHAVIGSFAGQLLHGVGGHDLRAEVQIDGPHVRSGGLHGRASGEYGQQDDQRVRVAESFHVGIV